MRTLFITMLCFIGMINCDLTGDIVIDDGLVHDINYAVDEALSVYDSAAGVSSRVNVFGGAELSSLATFDQHSYLSMTDGAISGDLWMKGDSAASITGGTINDCAFGGSSVSTITGAAVISSCHITGGASVSIDGNVQINNLGILESPSVTIRNGQFNEFNSLGSPVLDISGGVFSAYSMNVSVNTGSISGGVFEGVLQMGGNFEISGGSFSGMQLGCSSDLTFIGSDFAVNGKKIESGDTVDDWDLTEIPLAGAPGLSGIFTGTLTDGSQMNQIITLQDCRCYGFDVGSISFIPEPASMWLVLAGCGLLIRRKAVSQMVLR